MISSQRGPNSRPADRTCSEPPVNSKNRAGQQEIARYLYSGDPACKHTRHLCRTYKRAAFRADETGTLSVGRLFAVPRWASKGRAFLTSRKISHFTCRTYPRTPTP